MSGWWTSPGGYGSSPYPNDPYTFPGSSSYSDSQAPTQNWNEKTGEFNITLNQPAWIEVNSTGRFNVYFVHQIDGACLSMTSGPTLAILDANSNPVPSSFGVTIGTVTAGQGTGIWFATVQFNAALLPGNYQAQWTATYTPVNTQEPQIPLPIQIRRTFTVKKTEGTSQFVFKRVSTF